MRQASNRTFQRILASLSPKVAERYGQKELAPDSSERRLQEAISAKDWNLVAQLSAELAGQTNHSSAAKDISCEIL